MLLVWMLLLLALNTLDVVVVFFEGRGRRLLASIALGREVPLRRTVVLSTRVPSWSSLRPLRQGPVVIRVGRVQGVATGRRAVDGRSSGGGGGGSGC